MKNHKSMWRISKGMPTEYHEMGADDMLDKTYKEKS